MSDGSIRIKIGASADRSIDTVFGTFEQRAEKAKNVISRTGTETGQAMARGFAQSTRAAEKAQRDVERIMRQQDAVVERATRERTRFEEKAARERVRIERQAQREVERAARESYREVERLLRQRERDEERTAHKIESQQRQFAQRTSQRAVRFLFPPPIGAFGMASRIGHDILRGAGVDFSVAGSVGRSVGAQSLATQLSNQGYMKGQAGPNGTRVAAGTLEKEARAIGKDQSMDPQALLRAQTKFVDLTGNLNDARQALPKIAALSGATGTDPEKMAEAWANVSRHMGDIPNKAAKVEGLMRMIAGQGRVGSIEIKDEAKDLGKIAAAADRFAGKDKADTIGKLTTLAQLSRAEGGSASSTQAATSVARFVDTFQSSTRLKKFTALGINPYVDKGHTQLDDPFKIIREAIVKTHGSQTGLNELFKSVMSQRAITALSTAYNSKGGGKAGLAEVDRKLAEFGKEATLTPEQVQENNAERNATTEAKAQRFQNQLDEIVEKIATQAIPAFEKLGPKVLELVDAFGRIVTWAASNPGTALLDAVGLSIARAGLESVFRFGVEKAMMAAAGSGGGLALTGTVMMTAMAVTLINKDIADRVDKQNKDALGNAEAGVTESRVARAAAEGGEIDPEDARKMREIEANLQKRIELAEKQKSADAADAEADKNDLNKTDAMRAMDKRQGVRPGEIGPLGMLIETLFHPERGEARNDAGHMRELKDELAMVHQKLDLLAKGTLKVHLTNPGDIHADGAGDTPKVSGKGRGSHPAHAP